MILRKIIIILIQPDFRIKFAKLDFGWVPTQRPLRSPDFLAGFKGDTCKERNGREKKKRCRRRKGEREGKGRVMAVGGRLLWSLSTNLTIAISRTFRKSADVICRLLRI